MEDAWERLAFTVASCQRCGLCKGRSNTAFGEGDVHSRILLVGEAPGQEEDRLGRPFVGPAGQLLDRMLAAVDIRREDVYIANVVKCRPPGNRNPSPEEAESCLMYLRLQYALLQPQIVLCLGAVAMRHLMGQEKRITRDRGVWELKNGVWFMGTYHPAALLRDESKKREAWQDMQTLRDKIKELSIT